MKPASSVSLIMREAIEALLAVIAKRSRKDELVICSLETSFRHAC